jgi:hypothetical protein
MQVRFNRDAGETVAVFYAMPACSLNCGTAGEAVLNSSIEKVGCKY